MINHFASSDAHQVGLQLLRMWAVVCILHADLGVQLTGICGVCICCLYPGSVSVLYLFCTLTRWSSCLEYVGSVSAVLIWGLHALFSIFRFDSFLYLRRERRRGREKEVGEKREGRSGFSLEILTTPTWRVKNRHRKTPLISRPRLNVMWFTDSRQKICFVETKLWNQSALYVNTSFVRFSLVWIYPIPQT